MDNPKLRKPTWYWRIWWFFGYHGLYQINWAWKKFMVWLKKSKVQSGAPSQSVRQRLADLVFDKKVKVEIHSLVRKTACGRHAWYNSNVGLIRKPVLP